MIRQLEVSSLQMLDDYYADNGIEQFDDGGERLAISEGAGGSEEVMETEEKLFEFQRTIQRLREAFRQRKASPKK